MNRTRPKGERILALHELGDTHCTILQAEECWLEAKHILKVKRVQRHWTLPLALDGVGVVEEGWVGTVEDGEVHITEFTQLTIGQPLGKPINVDVAECAAFVRSLLGWGEP